MIQLLRKVLTMAIERIDAGNCNISDNEALQIASFISEVSNQEKRVSKAQACAMLHCSRATFDNYVRLGLIPHGQKQQGFKELSWRVADIRGYMKKRC